MINRHKLYKEVIGHFGEDAQMEKAVEELTELSLALQHFLSGKVSDVDVITEVADVLIMCEQLSIIFDSKEITKEIHVKIKRLKGLVDNEKSTQVSKQ